jgi:hypothetical protein
MVLMEASCCHQNHHQNQHQAHCQVAHHPLQQHIHYHLNAQASPLVETFATAEEATQPANQNGFFAIALYKASVFHDTCDIVESRLIFGPNLLVAGIPLIHLFWICC